MRLSIKVYFLNLCFLTSEGEQHYHYLPTAFGTYRELQSFVLRDKIKEQKCRERQISLVFVPYWWDATETSLEGLVEEQMGGSVSLLAEGI